jgi:hypothetical protein
MESFLPDDFSLIRFRPMCLIVVKFAGCPMSGEGDFAEDIIVVQVKGCRSSTIRASDSKPKVAGCHRGFDWGAIPISSRYYDNSIHLSIGIALLCRVIG